MKTNFIDFILFMIANLFNIIETGAQKIVLKELITN